MASERDRRREERREAHYLGLSGKVTRVFMSFRKRDSYVVLRFLAFPRGCVTWGPVGRGVRNLGAAGCVTWGPVGRVTTA